MNIMKSIKLYLYSALLLVLSIMASCSEVDESADLGVMEEGEGALALSCDLIVETKAAALSAEEVQDRLEDYILKIYSVSTSGSTELIRYYKPAYEIPEVLYLTSGNYKATLSMQVDAEPTYATRDPYYYTYEGEQAFTIAKDEQTDVTITCGVINSVVRMQLDAASFATNSSSSEYTFDSATGSIIVDANGSTSSDENVIVRNIVGYVSADSCTSAEDVIKSSTSYMLEYNFVDGSGAASSEVGVDFVCDDGYFMLPEDATALYYAISFEYSDKLDSEFETYTSYGKITNIKNQTIYTLAMSCAQADTGSVGLNVSITNSEYDEGDNDFSFSPQPTISGDGIDAAFDYVGGSKVYDLAALIPMSSVTITRDGVSYDLMADGDVKSVDFVESLELSDDKLSATLTLNNNFYSGFNAGGENSYTITVTDEKSAVGTASPKAKLTGMLKTISSANYWNNTGTLTAYIAESDASSAVVYCRREGETEWREMSMPNGVAHGDNSANIDAAWSSVSKNSSGHSYYNLEFGVAAGATYECKLEVDGVQRGGEVSITVGGTKDLIPYAEMNSTSGLTCFGNSNTSTTNWGSGNNSMSSGLCSFSSDYGDGCAYLAAKSGVTLVGIAPGNLFLGRFDMSGMNGTVSFGQSFTYNSRPTSFKFRYRSTVGTVNNAYHSGAPLSKGDADILTIYFAIVDWSGRHDVTSGTSSPSGVWDPESYTSVDKGNIIGYAMFDTSTSTTTFDEVEIPVNYYDMVTNPSSSNISIVISCSTSKYGDYLTGCDTNRLWIDNFEFGY